MKMIQMSKMFQRNGEVVTLLPFSMLYVVNRYE